MCSLTKFLEKTRIQAAWKYLAGDVLDIGCGDNTLIHHYKRGVGVDIIIPPDHKEKFKLITDASKLPFKDESFDTITMLASYNHIPNREQCLKECYRLLRPQGHVLITMLTPKLSKTWHLLRFGKNKDSNEREMNEGEIYGITRKNLVFQLKICGFFHEHTERFMIVNRLYVFRKIGKNYD